MHFFHTNSRNEDEGPLRSSALPTVTNVAPQDSPRNLRRQFAANERDWGAGMDQRPAHREGELANDVHATGSEG